MEQSLQLLRTVEHTLFAKDSQLAQQQALIAQLQNQITALEKKVADVVAHGASAQIKLIDQEKELESFKCKSVEHAETQTEPEPEPEPAITAEEPEPQPEPAITAEEPEPQPEPAITAEEPEPEPEAGPTLGQLATFAAELTQRGLPELVERQAVRAILEHELKLIAVDAVLAQFEVGEAATVLARIMPELDVIHAETKVVFLELVCAIKDDQEKEARARYEDELRALSQPKPRTLESIEDEAAALEDEIAELQAKTKAHLDAEKRQAAKAARKLAAELKAAQEKQAREAKLAKAEAERKAREEARREAEAKDLLVRSQQMAKSRAERPANRYSNPETKAEPLASNSSNPNTKIKLPGHDQPELRAAAVAVAVTLRQAEKRDQLGRDMESFVRIAQSVFKKRNTDHGFKFQADCAELPKLLDLYIQESLGMSVAYLEKHSLKKGLFGLYFVLDKCMEKGHYSSPLVEPEQLVLWLENNTFVRACDTLFGYVEPGNNLSDRAFILGQFEAIKDNEAFLLLQITELQWKDCYGLPLQNIKPFSEPSDPLTISMLAAVIWFKMGKIACMASPQPWA